MSRPSLGKLEELFNRAVALPPDECAAFLDRECAGNPDLRLALEAMLRHDREDTAIDGRFAGPLADAASALRHDAPTLPAAAVAGALHGRVPFPEIPGYEILQELGRGGMGVVYKARQLALNRLVALKMLLPFAAPDAEQLRRFKTEAEALARLSHPNVVPIYEVGECPAGPYFSMEFVPGPSLGAYIDGKPCDPYESVRIIETLAGAIDAVHRSGIVHRDLKPANILLLPRVDSSTDVQAQAGGRRRLSGYDPKITDFGLAKNLFAQGGLTLSGTTLGTPFYMAPEQANSKSNGVGPAADLYALGAILYEMLTGRPPFDGYTAAETIARVVSSDPLPPSQLRPGLPRDLSTICMKCLEKSPRQRYARGSDLAEDLRRFQAGEPIRARPIGPLARAYRWGRRRPAVAGLLALCALMAIAFVVTVLIYDIRLRDALDQARRMSEEERQDIVQLHVTIGITEMERGDSFAALLHFTEAFHRDQASAERERNHRTRIGVAIDRSPQLLRLLIPGKKVLCTQLDDSGGQIATTGADHVVEIWDVQTGRTLGPALPHEDAVTSAAFSPDGRSLATVVAGGLVRHWNLAEGTAQTLRKSDGTTTSRVAFHPDGRLLLARGTNSALESIDPLAKNQSTQDSVRTLAISSHNSFSPDCRQLLTWGDGHRAQVWDTATAKSVGPGQEVGAGLVTGAFSQDGRRIALLCTDQSIRIADVRTGASSAKPILCRLAVSEVIFSPDGERMLAIGSDSASSIWNASTGQLVAVLPKQQGETTFVRFSPDGRMVLTGNSVEGARVWNAWTGTALTPPLRQSTPLIAASFCKDGRRLLLVGETGVVCVWKLPDDVMADLDDPAETSTARAQFSQVPQPIASQTLLVESRGVNSKGKRLELRQAVGGACIYDADTGQAIAPILRHPDVVEFACFSTDGSRLCTADAKRNVRTWDCLTGELLAPVRTMPRSILRLEESKVICMGGKEFPYQAREAGESVVWLTALARVLACGDIDDSRERQVYDAKQLRSARDALDKAPHY